MKYYIILLLAIAATGCKKEDPKPNTLEQTIAKMQGVRMYKGMYITMDMNTLEGYHTVDTQWLDNYPVLIFPTEENTISMRSLDSTRPSFSSYALVSGATPPCWECIVFGMTMGNQHYSNMYSISYNTLSDKVIKIKAMSTTIYGSGTQRVTKEEFELTEQ